MTWTHIQARLIQIADIDVPIPDLALIAAFCAILGLMGIVSRRERDDAVQRVERTYISELARANRQADAARSNLSKARAEVEKYRRRARGR